MLFADVVATSAAVGATSSRLAKAEALKSEAERIEAEEMETTLAKV